MSPPRRKPRQDRDLLAKARSEGIEDFYLHASMGIDSDGPYVGITIRNHEEPVSITLDVSTAIEFFNELDDAITAAEEVNGREG